MGDGGTQQVKGRWRIRAIALANLGTLRRGGLETRPFCLSFHIEFADEDPLFRVLEAHRH
jgi:hypothetical protein